MYLLNPPLAGPETTLLVSRKSYTCLRHYKTRYSQPPDFFIVIQKQETTKTRREFASKPSERPTRSYCCDAQKYFLCTVKSAIIQKYLIMEPPEKRSQNICQLNIS